MAYTTTGPTTYEDIAWMSYAGCGMGVAAAAVLGFISCFLCSNKLRHVLHLDNQDMQKELDRIRTDPAVIRAMTSANAKKYGVTFQMPPDQAYGQPGQPYGGPPPLMPGPSYGQLQLPPGAQGYGPPGYGAQGYPEQATDFYGRPMSRGGSRGGPPSPRGGGPPPTGRAPSLVPPLPGYMGSTMPWQSNVIEAEFASSPPK